MKEPLVSGPRTRQMEREGAGRLSGWGERKGTRREKDRSVRKRPLFLCVYALGSEDATPSFRHWAGLTKGSDSCGPLSFPLSRPTQHPCPVLHRSPTPLGSFIPSPSLRVHSAQPRPPFTLSRCSTFPSVLQHSEEAAFVDPERLCPFCTPLRATSLDARPTVV